MDLLSKDDTLRFIRDVLEIPITQLPSLSNSSSAEKLAFIETILKSHLEREPFQSISLMALKMKDRHRPSWDEIKSNMFARQGGLCYWHNTFMYVLLSSLGFDVSMAHSTVTGFDADNHVVVNIHDLVKPGDLHLVDVGIGFYIPRVIDFVDESPVYKDSILTYKFKKVDDKRIALLKTVEQVSKSSSSNHSGDQDSKQASVAKEDTDETKQNLEKSNIKNDTKETEWEVLYYYNFTDRFRNLEEFFPCFDIHFTDITKLPFHTSPRAMRWSNGRFIGIVNNKLLEEKEAGRLTKTPLIPDDGKDVKPLVEAYARYFPQFPSDLVLAALTNWKEMQSLAKLPNQMDY